MKHTWVTSLSVFGIIGAGSAAVLANTTVFNGVAKTNAAITISSTLPASATTTVTAAVTDPTAATTTAAPGAVPQPYQVGDSGTVQLTTANGLITINSALPAPGWTIQSASVPGTWVVVEFQSQTQLVVFNAFIIDGQVQVVVDAGAPGTAAQVAAAVTASNSARPAAASNVAPPTTSKTVTATSHTTSPTTVAHTRTPRTSVPRLPTATTDKGGGGSDD
jgi:hypothetical protein